ncbi:MAG: amino acid adenylation domain-containing protein [Candidatus Binatia bacterium]
MQYADYALWQREWLKGPELERQLSYWKKQLEGAPGVLNLPTDHPRPAVQTYRGARQSIELSRELTQGLKALSQKEGVTLFMTLLAAFQTLLHRYTGQEDVAVGSPIASRTRPELEDLIGFFVNTLVFRTELPGNPTFEEVLARVRKIALAAYEHQDLPFEKLVEELKPERSLSHSPLFQVMFVLQNAPSTALNLEGLRVSPVRVGGETAKFDLTLFMHEGAEGLRASLQYSSDLFNQETITRMLGHFEVLLQSIVANSNRPIWALPILTAAEKQQLLVEWNDTQKDYPRDKCLHELFEEQVEKTPDAVAVIFEDQQLTYRDLNARANQLAHHLRKLGVGPDVLVGLCVERSLAMLVALLGILKAGGAYVPLDPEYPKERLAYVLEDANLSTLVTQQRLFDHLPDHKARVFNLDTDCDLIAREREENPAGGGTAQNIAYVIYTSGSTGKPKGVMIAHHALCNRLLWGQEAYPLAAADRVLQLASFSFDFSVWEFFGPLLVGARLIMNPPGQHLDSAKTIEIIADQKITTVHFVPSALEVFLEDDGLQACNSLRRVFCGGENLPVKLQERFYSRLEADLYNQYGPTEACIDATFWKCEQGDFQQSVPIGRPIANTQIYLLDSHLHLVPVGVPGEIYIGGDGLARGYLNRPELTAEKFIANPFSNEPGGRLYRTGDLARYLPDGNIEFLGRVDHQVKIRGFRIELGEIESVLGQQAAVREAAVLAREDNPGDKRLVAYVVPRQEAAPTISELRSFLKQKLPEYMIPSLFVFLDSLPLSPNGKVDRKALPAPDQNRPESDESYVAPRTPAEQILAAIWAKLLGVNQVGIRDNFFDLGGHSLLAVRLFAEIEKAFKKRPPLASLFQEATIEHLASLISENNPTTKTTPPSLVAIQPRGTKRPFFCVHTFFGDVLCYMNLARHLGSDQPFYTIEARGFNGIDEPFDDIKTMAAYYIEQIRAIQPQGPYALGGLCSAGIVAFEMAQQLRAKGEDVAMVALFDSQARPPRDEKLAYKPSFRDLLRDIPSWLIGSLELNRSQWVDLVKLKVRMAKAKKAVSSRTDDNSQNHAAKLIQEWGGFFHFSEQHHKIARAQSRALREYQLQVYPGRLTLFKARMQPLFSSHRPDKGWGRLAAGGLEVRIVPGNQLAMLKEPHVRVLAEQLSGLLA